MKKNNVLARIFVKSVLMTAGFFSLFIFPLNPAEADVSEYIVEGCFTNSLKIPPGINPDVLESTSATFFNGHVEKLMNSEGNMVVPAGDNETLKASSFGQMVSGNALNPEVNTDPEPGTYPDGIDDPASAMYSLEDIYQRLATGAEGWKRTGPFDPPKGAVTPTGHTIDQIMNAAPQSNQPNYATLGDVAVGKTFWGLKGHTTWGAQTGTAGESIRNPSEDYLIQAMDTYDWLGSVSVGDLHAAQQTESVGWPELLNIIAERLLLIEKLDTSYLQIGNKIAFNAHEKAVLERLSLYSTAALAGIRMTFAALVEIEAAGCMTDQLFHERILKGEIIDPGSLKPQDNPGAKLNAPASPQNPAGIMYTLTDLYNRLNEGAEVTRANAFVGPSAGPGPTGYDLNAIMGAAPAKNDLSGATPADVAIGKAFWGLRSDGWGVMVGNAGTGDDDGFTALDVVKYDWLSGFTFDEIWDAVNRSAVTGLQEFLDATDAIIQAVRDLNTPYLQIPLRLRYDPDEQELIARLKSLKDEGLSLADIRTSFAELAALHGAGLLSEDYLRNEILSGRVVDSSFLDDPVAYLNSRQAGLIPSPSGSAYTDVELTCINKIAWYAANGLIDLPALATAGFSQIVSVAENPDYSNLTTDDLVQFFGCPIVLTSDTVIFNPKFVPDIPLSFHVGLPKSIDDVVIEVQDSASNVIESLYDGAIGKTDLVLRWNGRQTDGSFLEEGSYRFFMKARKYGAVDGKVLTRSFTWLCGNENPENEVSVSSLFVGNRHTGEWATVNSDLEFYNKNLPGRILKFELFDGQPEVHFYNGVKKASASNNMGGGAWATSFDSYEFDLNLSGEISLYHEEFGNGCDWFGTDSIKSKLYAIVDGQPVLKLEETHRGHTARYDAPAGRYRVTFEANAVFDCWGGVTVYYQVPTVFKASGDDLADISEESFWLFDSLVEQLQNTDTQSVSLGTYTYTCEPPLVDMYGNGTIVIRRESVTDTNDVAYIVLEDTFESGDIHVNTDGTDLWLCWLAASPDPDDDPNTKAPIIRKVILAEQDPLWRPVDTELILQWARNRGIDLSDYENENDLLTEYIALLELLKNGEAGTDAPLIVPAPHDCYNPVPFGRILDFLGEDPVTSTNVIRSFLCAFMEANPLRFWYEGATLADLSEVDRMAAIEAIVDAYSLSDLLKALEFGVMVGIGDNPYEEPEVTRNQFNSSNGLRLEETDLEISYLGEPIFKITRKYDSSGARFRPSFVGVNREKEVLSNYFTERDFSNLLPLELKPHVAAFGNGWGLTIDGSLLVNFISFDKARSTDDDQFAVGISALINGKVISFSFSSEDIADYDRVVAADDFRPTSKHDGYRLRITSSTDGGPVQFRAFKQWCIDVLGPDGIVYMFHEKAIDYSDIFKKYEEMWLNSDTLFFDGIVSKQAYKLSTETRPDTVCINYHYTSLENFSPPTMNTVLRGTDTALTPTGRFEWDVWKGFIQILKKWMPWHVEVMTQDFDLDYRMPRLYRIEVSKGDELINNLDFTYRNHYHSFVLPDAYKALQVKKIVSHGAKGEDKEIWYHYNNSDMLASVEVNRESMAEYSYERHDSDVLGPTWLLTNVVYRNGASRTFEYALNELDPASLADGVDEVTDEEREIASQLVLKTDTLDGTKVTAYDYGDMATYVPYEDTDKYNRAFYFTGITQTRRDGTVVDLEFEKGLPTKRSIEVVKFVETSTYNWEERWLTSRTVNDNGQVKSTDFSEHDEKTGIPQRIETTDVSKAATEIKTKQLVDSTELLEANVLGLVDHESREFQGRLSRDVTNDFYSGDYDPLTNPGYPGALKKSVITEDLSGRTSITLGDFLPGRNVSSRSYTYDEHGRVKSVESELSKVDYAYLPSKDPNTGSDLITQEATATVWYDDLLAAEQPSVDEVSYKSSKTFDLATGLLVAETDITGGRTIYEYANDKLTRKTYPDGTNETWAYDFINRTITHTDRNGLISKQTFNTDGREISTDYASVLMADSITEYDDNGRPQEEQIVQGETLLFKNTLKHDPRGRQIKLENTRGESALTTYQANNVQQVILNGKQKVLAKTDSFGAAESIKVFDMSDNLQRDVTIESGEHHHPVQVNFKKGNGKLTRTMKNEADGTQILNETSEGLKKVTIRGTGFTETVRSFDSFSERLLFLKDGIGRFVSVSKRVGTDWVPLKTFRYDEGASESIFQTGKLTSAFANGLTASYKYDVNGHITEETLDLGKTFTVNYQFYSGKHNLLESIQIGEHNIRYGYDAVGRLNSITFDLAGEERTFALSYLATNRLTHIVYPNGISVQRSYGIPTGNLDQIIIKRGTTLLRTMTYTYDAGLIIQKNDSIVEDLPNITYRVEEVYNRDGEESLTQVISTDNLGNKRRDTFLYDDGYSVKRHTSEPWSENIGSDFEVLYAYADISNGYPHDSNRLVAMMVNDQARDQGWMETTVDYNTNTLRPSVITRGNARAVDYDEFNHQTKDGGWDYVLDHKGNRVIETDGNETIYRIFDQFGNLFAEADSTGEVQSIFIWGPENLLLGKIALNESGSTVEYYAHDHLGSNILTTDVSGTTLTQNQYSVWGVPKRLYILSGYAGNDFIFTGKLYDGETRSYNLGFRTYYPEIKRFLIGDSVLSSLKEMKSFNAYVYAKNDPIAYIDPYGLSPMSSLSDPYGLTSEDEKGEMIIGVVGLTSDVVGTVGILSNLAGYSSSLGGFVPFVSYFSGSVQFAYNTALFLGGDIPVGTYMYRNYETVGGIFLPGFSMYDDFLILGLIYGNKWVGPPVNHGWNMGTDNLRNEFTMPEFQIPEFEIAETQPGCSLPFDIVPDGRTGPWDPEHVNQEWNKHYRDYNPGINPVLWDLL